MTQVTIAWTVTPLFDPEDLVNLLEKKFKISQEPPPNEHILNRWKTDNITVHRYEKKVLVQAKRTNFTTEVATSIGEVRGLDLDQKNVARLASLVPVAQNAILCEDCNKPSTLLVGDLEEMDLKIKNECGHINKLTPPYLMLGNRIIPDINVIVGNNLSMCLNLGYFKDFEIVLPKFLFDAIDNYLGPKLKKGALGEFANLMKLQEEGVISLLYVEAGKHYDSHEEFGREEDDFVLDQAKLTNSVILTSDEGLKTKAIMSNRPVIFLPATLVSDLKHLEEIRGCGD